MKGRRGQQKVPRLAPLCQGHEETKRLAATNSAVDLDRLLRAIRQAGGVVTVSNGGQQENGNDPLETTSNQQVGSTASQPQAPPPGGQSSLTFPRFSELAPEVRSMIWQDAINIPRLIYIHIGIPGTGAWSVFDRFILNMNYLAETENSLSSLFSTCRESRGELRRAARPGPDPSRARWADMLGLAQLRPTGADLVYMGGLNDLGRTPPADTNRIIPLALVLGDVLPWVMVNADIFVSYFNPDPNEQPENPTDKALADLRALGNAYAPQAAREDGLHAGQLPAEVGDCLPVHDPGPQGGLYHLVLYPLRPPRDHCRWGHGRLDGRLEPV